MNKLLMREETHMIDQWLDHLVHTTPLEGYGNKMSMFLISLEAWRRGISVKYYTIDNPENKLLVRYTLSYQGRSVSFESSQSYQLSNEVLNICDNKHLTKEHLRAHNIRVPKGEKLLKDTEPDKLDQLANKLTYPVVMKPVSENAGKGVFSNIINKTMLFETFAYLTNELGYKEVLLEEFIEGEEHRVLTVGKEVVGVVKRVPANIEGNGKSSIRELIQTKNKSKQKNPVIYKKKIEIDREVEEQLSHAGYKLSDILEKGKRLYLRSKSNISTGGDPIDVMDNIDPSVIEMGEKVAEAIPGLEVAGIDIIINPKTNEKAVIEINTRPMIGLHVFPMEGQPRDVVKAIVDFYFPETKDIKRSRLYFDFGKITGSLDNVTTKEIELQPISPQQLYAKRFLVYLTNDEHQYRKDIRRLALADGLFGYAKGVGDYFTEVVLASPIKAKIDAFFPSHHRNLNHEFEIQEEEEWYYPINVGFVTAKQIDNSILTEINNQVSKKRINRLIKVHQDELDHIQEQLNQATNEATIYKNAYLKIEKQNKKMKAKQKDLEALLAEQKDEVERLKDELNRKLYKKFFKKTREN